jgi:hypothetical protein
VRQRPGPSIGRRRPDAVIADDDDGAVLELLAELIEVRENSAA